MILQFLLRFFIVILAQNLKICRLHKKLDTYYVHTATKIQKAENNLEIK